MVNIQFRKFDRRPTWAAEGVLLGEDEHGTWVGFPARTPWTHPNRPTIRNVSGGDRRL